MMRLAEGAGLGELFKQIAARFELHHGHGEPPRDVWVKAAIHGLKQMKSVEARSALEKLSESADENTSRGAKEALAAFSAPD